MKHSAAPQTIEQKAAGGFRQFTRSTKAGSSSAFLDASTILIGFTSLGVVGTCWGDRLGALLTSVVVPFSLFCSVLCSPSRHSEKRLTYMQRCYHARDGAVSSYRL